MSRPRILIDCDPGHDDLVAILFAARHLDLVGITTVHGNNTLENTTRNALKTLELGGLDVPLAAGCAGPLAQAGIGIASGHGASGLDGASLPDPRRRPVDMHAVDFLIETAHMFRGELILAVIGPATNIALALRREPRLKDWLREITIMGGSTTGGNVSPAAEYNIACDVEAAWALFESGARLRMVGLNVTQATGFDVRDIARLRASGRRVAGVVADLMQFYLDRTHATYGVDVAPMHDVCAIVPYVFPELIGTLHTSVRVETTGTFTRGMTLCDLRHPAGSAAPLLRNRTAPNAHVAISVHSRALIDAVLDTLLTYD